MKHGVSRTEKHDQEVTVLRRSKFGEKYTDFFGLLVFCLVGFFNKEKPCMLACRPAKRPRPARKQGSSGHPPRPRRAARSHAWVGRVMQPLARRDAPRPPRLTRAGRRRRDPAPTEGSFPPAPPPPFPPSHRRRGLTLSGGKATGALPAEPGKGHNGETVINPPPGETAASDSAVPPARQKGAGAEGSTGNQIKSNKPERGTAVSPHRRNKQARCPLHGARRRAAPSGERPAAPRRPPEPPWPAGRTGGACGACSPPTCPPRPAAPNRAEPSRRPPAPGPAAPHRQKPTRNGEEGTVPAAAAAKLRGTARLGSARSDSPPLLPAAAAGGAAHGRANPRPGRGGTGTGPDPPGRAAAPPTAPASCQAPAVPPRQAPVGAGSAGRGGPTRGLSGLPPSGSRHGAEALGRGPLAGPELASGPQRSPQSGAGPVGSRPAGSRARGVFRAGPGAGDRQGRGLAGVSSAGRRGAHAALLAPVSPGLNPRCL